MNFLEYLDRSPLSPAVEAELIKAVNNDTIRETLGSMGITATGEELHQLSLLKSEDIGVMKDDELQSVSGGAGSQSNFIAQTSQWVCDCCGKTCSVMYAAVHNFKCSCGGHFITK